MKVLTVPFNLQAWRLRMGWTQARAAEALGLSLSGYQHMEYGNLDRPGFPLRKPYAILAEKLERERQQA